MRVVAGVIVSFFSLSSFSADTLLQCGYGTLGNFNGWSIQPYKAFTNVVFEDHAILVEKESGGNVSLELVRQFSDLSLYNLVEVNYSVAAMRNCSLNDVEIAVSTDRKNWKTIASSSTNEKSFFTKKLEAKFLKIKLTADFRNEGVLAINRLVVVNHDEKNEIVPEVNNEEIILPHEDFFMFFYNRSVNIETTTEEPYQLIISNLAGQIVYSDNGTGSTRFEPELNAGAYIISILRNGELVKSKKVVFTD